jgi:hypothetical protein
LIDSLEQITGWQMEIPPEANQAALNALVREVLPEGWQIAKGPAIHREQKRVAVSLTPNPSPEGRGGPMKDSHPQIREEQGMMEKFRNISGWELAISEAAQPVSGPVAAQPTGQRMEINAAYAFIKSALEGSTLYRTSLKGDEIMLSFISPQVAERHQEKINQLAAQTGWPLSINPQPNQGAILEAARALLAKAGFAVKKGPSIYLEKSEVSATLASSPTTGQQADLTEAFERETGFRLNLNTAIPQKPMETAPRNNVAEIPLDRIRITGYHQSLDLDPAKLDRAIERARIMGITPPIRVRRARDGYLLTDGLYRLRAAEALGLERIPAIVE